MVRPRLTLALLPACSDEGVVLEARRYRNIGFGTGFYDWLRDARGGLLGIRYTPSVSVPSLHSQARSFPYVVADDTKPGIEFYFSANRRYDPAKSMDQDFGDNWVYAVDEDRSAALGLTRGNVEYLISFGIQGLAEADMGRLRQVPADWLS